MRVLGYDTLDSTNAEARRLLASGAISPPTCLVAREQTAGRGTRGRAWCSPRDAGVYLSMITRPPRGGPATVLYTLAAGVACAEAIEQVAGVTVELRAVNDLWVAGRKLGGILVETVAEAGVVASIVTGVGINVRDAPRTVEAGASRPVCLEELVPPPAFAALRNETLVREIARRVEAWIAVAAREETERIRRSWSQRSVAGAETPTIA